jgi:hypothetical protein
MNPKFLRFNGLLIFYLFTFVCPARIWQEEWKDNGPATSRAEEQAGGYR